MNNSKFFNLILATFLAFSVSSCNNISWISKTGIGVGIFIAVAVVVLIVLVILKANKRHD
jgi:uncharacterized membrane protein